MNVINITIAQMRVISGIPDQELGPCIIRAFEIIDEWMTVHSGADAEVDFGMNDNVITRVKIPDDAVAVMFKLTFGI